VAARQSAPVIGALCGSLVPSFVQTRTDAWYHGMELTAAYRYQSSFRHFVGTVEQKQRELDGTQIVNNYHLFDVAVTYPLTRRIALTGSLPILLAERNQLYAPRGIYNVNGIGDMTLGTRTWLFRPPTESGANIALGFSLKFPTGKYNATDLAVSSTGQTILATADQSIQAGDGGFGFVLDTQAYQPIFGRSMLYFSGTYLFNPRNTNGVSTFRRRRYEEVMSVADQYLFRGGISRPVPKIRGLVAGFGGRIEGVPVRDAFGRSDGFRRPGYAISLDPGVMYVIGQNLFSLNIPFAVERNRRRSTTDILNGVHGDAAFADYALVISYTRRF
jgi:hypothetical protein